MKTCSKCGEMKPPVEFAVRKDRDDGRHTICKACVRVYARTHYELNRGYYLEKAARARADLRARTFEQLIAYLRDHPCVDCGESDVRVLHFDHVDPSTKEDLVSRLLRVTTWERALEEIAKCVVRCANCHRRRTAQQFGYLRSALSRAGIMERTRE